MKQYTAWYPKEKQAEREWFRRMKPPKAKQFGNCGTVHSATVSWSGLHGWRYVWHDGDWQAADMV
jgi:hypothetical protein